MLLEVRAFLVVDLFFNIKFTFTIFRPTKRHTHYNQCVDKLWIKHSKITRNIQVPKSCPTILTFDTPSFFIKQ